MKVRLLRLWSGCAAIVLSATTWAALRESTSYGISPYQPLRANLRDSSPDNRVPRAAGTCLALAFGGATVAFLGAPGVAIFIAIAYYLLCLTKPSVGLAWSFAFLPLNVPEFVVAGVTLRPFELFVWPAAVLAILASLHEGSRLSKERAKTLIPGAAFLVYVLSECVVLWGATSAVEMRFWTSSFLLMLAFFLRAEDDQTSRHLVWSMAAGVSIMLCVAVSQRVFGAPFFAGMVEPRDVVQLVLFKDRTPVPLANSTFTHPNAAGAYLTVALPLLLATSVSRGSRIAILGTIAALTALYLTYSRGAGLAAIGSLIAVAFVLSDKPKRRWLLGAAGTLALAMVVLVSLASSVAEYWLTFSLGVRYLIWAAYFHVWLSSPFIGVGPGNSFVQAQFLSPYGSEYVAHN